MSVQIRHAKPEDARVIARIAEITEVASIDAGSARVRKILSQGRTIVATVRGDVAGFADGFFTVDQSDGRRFELDLLAVAPAMQGRGVGGALVAASLAAAAAGGARKLRALVRCDNAVMKKLCQRHGFHCSADVYELHVKDSHPVAALARHHHSRMLKVETLGYAGIWLEGDISQPAIAAAEWRASQGDASLIGAVIPVADVKSAALLEANSFARAGHYNWWSLNLRSD